MADYETTGPEIRKLVLKSARRPVAFAFNPGIDVKDSYLALSKRKSASHLHRVTKREGPGNKVASGKLTLEGREVVLTCDIDISALARRFKYYLAENGMSYKVRVLDKNGALIDTDLEKATQDDPEEDAAVPQGQATDEAPAQEAEVTPPEPSADPEQEDPQTAALRAAFEGLQPLLERVQEGQDQNAAKAVTQLGQDLAAQLDNADTETATKTLKVFKKNLVLALRGTRSENANTDTAA